MKKTTYVSVEDIQTQIIGMSKKKFVSLCGNTCR